MLLTISKFSWLPGPSIQNMHVTDHTQEWFIAKVSACLKTLVDVYPAPYKDIITMTLRRNGFTGTHCFLNHPSLILLKFLPGTRNFLPLPTYFRRNTKLVCFFSQHIMYFLSIDCQILKGSDHEYSLCKSMLITITITPRHSMHRCRMNGRAQGTEVTCLDWICSEEVK